MPNNNPICYIPRTVNLQPSDIHTIKKYAQDKGLGTRGFSVALRLIIREWQELHPTAEKSQIDEIAPAFPHEDMKSNIVEFSEKTPKKLSKKVFLHPPFP